MTTPSWVQDAIFYQIFPDRFANGNPANDPPNVQAWGSSPTSWGFQGGDLAGILQHFDYLLELGITAIYLNPIFRSASTHRYNTSDYFQIEPMLGSLDDFCQLLELAHSNHVKVILDGVFNHCGRGFFAFNDLLENHEHSPYRDWFHVIKFPPDAYSPGSAEDYLAWWGHKSLPKFNTSNPAVRSYLLSVARYWIEMGADGWRLDVPNEIDDDSFWEEFRQVVKTANPQAYLVGEIWQADPRWVGERHFDGLMNYPLRDAILRWLHAGTLTTSQFASHMEGLLNLYPPENLTAMYLTLSSHDTERLLTKLRGDVLITRFAYLFQFSLPGAPAIYYGDEIGLTGGNDPDCRGAFPWDDRQWNMELLGYVKKLITVRKQSPALRRGDYARLIIEDARGIFAFQRTCPEQKLVVALNASPTPQQVLLPADSIGPVESYRMHDLLNGQEVFVTSRGLELVLPAWGGAWLAN